MSDADLAAQMSALEKRCARLTLAVAVLGVAAGAALAWLAVRTPKIVTAQRYVLEDSGGQMRGEWAPSEASAGEENGKPVVASITCLQMRSTGRSRARLCAPWDEPGEPRLSLTDSTGSQASMIAAPFNAQVTLTTRAKADDQRPRSLALLMASHADSGVTLRHDGTASIWTSAGSVAPPPSANKLPRSDERRD
jgi:hypothetical protein